MTRLAALDLGSNSFHLLVADPQPGGRIRRVATRKLTLRLSEPIAATGELGPDHRERAAAAIAELLAVARAEGAERSVAVATEALRRAADSAAFRACIAREHGLRIQVLDGLEEAALSLRGMAAALRLRAPLLGLDLGGGSFEVAYGAGGQFQTGGSLPLGAAKVTAGLAHDPPWMAERVALHDEAIALLAPVAEAVAVAHGRSDEPLRAAGTAGTIRDLGRLGLALASGAVVTRVRGLVVTRAQLEIAVARLSSVGTEDRMQLPGVSAKRADLLPAGGVVLLAAMEAFGLEQIALCDWGLREGALLDVAVEGGVVAAEAALQLA